MVCVDKMCVFRRLLLAMRSLTLLLLLSQQPLGTRPGHVAAYSFSSPNILKTHKIETRLFAKKPPVPPKSPAGASSSMNNYKRITDANSVPLSDSNRLKKARLRLAEAQGFLPFGATESISLDDLSECDSSAFLKSLSSNHKPGSRMREISWRVAEPEVKYSPVATAKKLSGHPMRWIMRSAQIFVPITMFFVKVLKDLVLNQEERNRGKRAKELLQIISAQSPALIKAGQALSSRSDLLPQEYLEALEQLQDRCPSFPTDKALALFESEMKMKFEDVFEVDSLQPVAAASIGQVYKAKLRANGQAVAVKIQRPNCEDLIAMDLFILRWYSKRAQDILKLLKRDVNLVSVVDDFGELLYREIDYRAEAVNAQRFAELYANIPDVFVPKIYPSLSSRKVLTMEWVDGARLSDKAALQRMGLEGSQMVDILVKCTLRQMLDNGFFHADPHAGNLLAMDTGKLCYLDFGMVSYVEASQRYSIIESVVHMVNRDWPALCELYKRMGFIPIDVDAAPIIDALENALPDVLNAPVGDFNFKTVIHKLGDVMYKFPFSLPPFYISIIRCLGVLEGLAIQVDGNFRIVSDAYPYIASRLLTDSSPELQRALNKLLFKDNKLRYDRLEELLEKASDIGEYDFSQAIEQMVSYVVTPEAKVLRESVVDQIVDAIDQLEDEVNEIIMQFLRQASAGHTGSPLSILQAVVSSVRGNPKHFDALLDRILEMTEEKSMSTADGHITDGTSVLRLLIRALKIIRLSSSARAAAAEADAAHGSSVSMFFPKGVNTQLLKNVVNLLRRVFREPVLQELIGRVIAQTFERVSGKLVRKVFGRGRSASF